MRVWLLEWSDKYNAGTNITVFESVDAANKQACFEIQEHITSSWNFPNCSDEQKFITKIINDFIKNGDYKHARQAWNDCLYNQNDIKAQFWFITYENVCEFSSCDEPLIRPSSDFDPPATTDTESAVNKTVASASYQATDPGATCRTCHVPNEYAYADKPDGTFLCRSCSIFHNIFSS